MASNLLSASPVFLVGCCLLDCVLLGAAAVRVGEAVPSSLLVRAAPRGLASCVPVSGVLAFVGDWIGVWCLVGDGVGVMARAVDGDAGDSGRRNGDVRGEPKDNGEGLYVDDDIVCPSSAMAWWPASSGSANGDQPDFCDGRLMAEVDNTG